MTTLTLSTKAEAYLSVLKTTIAGLLTPKPNEALDTCESIPLSEIFADVPEKIPVIWFILPELHECRIRTSGEWTPLGLAQEWAKAETSRVHL
ncbi:MAG: hypothetical protein Q7R64_03520 [bacterium]|nr:hypothetical protein [bacterium]